MVLISSVPGHCLFFYFSYTPAVFKSFKLGIIIVSVTVMNFIGLYLLKKYNMGWFQGGKTWSYEECTLWCFNYCNVYNTKECILHKTRHSSYDQVLPRGFYWSFFSNVSASLLLYLT